MIEVHFAVVFKAEPQPPAGPAEAEEVLYHALCGALAAANDCATPFVKSGKFLVVRISGPDGTG